MLQQTNSHIPYFGNICKLKLKSSRLHPNPSTCCYHSNIFARQVLSGSSKTPNSWPAGSSYSTPGTYICFGSKRAQEPISDVQSAAKCLFWTPSLLDSSGRMHGSAAVPCYKSRSRWRSVHGVDRHGTQSLSPISNFRDCFHTQTKLF